jgi:hypothetical protein
MGRVSQKPLGWKCVESYMGQYAAYVGHGHKIGLILVIHCIISLNVRFAHFGKTHVHRL